MTSSASLPSSASAPRPGRRLAAIGLLSLTLFASAAPAALGEPDTNIQKPGHVAVQAL